MKVLFINHSDSLGGASTVTARLVEAMRARGTDARMLVTHRAGSDPWVALAAPRWRSRIPFLAEHARIFARNGFSRRDLFKASIATDGLPLSHHPWVREADAVVLNWVNQGMLSLGEIRRIGAARPLVWTMHDMWNLTGVCHHAGTCTRYRGECGHCPLLHGAAREADLSRETFRRKMELYASVPVHFVAVSSWLARKAAESALLRGRPVSVIPNSYAPVDPARLSRAELGLPAAGPLVAMCAARLDDPVKGLPVAVEALNAVADTGVSAVFVGALRDPSALAALRVPFVHLGPVADRARLQAVFAASAAVISSSLYESFGATLLEAQAAGVTPVSFVHDGRADIICDGLTGYAADSSAGAPSLALALRRAIESPIPPDRMREAAARFAPGEIAARYEKLIATLL